MKKIFGAILIMLVILGSTPLTILAATTNSSSGSSLEERTKQFDNIGWEDLKNANSSGQAGTGNTKSSDSSTAASEGIGGCVGSIVSGLITNALSSALGSVGSREVPVGDTLIHAKETGILGTGISWDKIGYCVANALISYIAQSTINWIKSGFDGSPAFVQDPQAFFKDIADQEAGNFIQELGGGFLCSSFRPQIQLALLQNERTTPYAQRAQCTLSKVVSNIDNFKQNFNNGGWQGWIELTQVPQNTPIGAYMQAQDELLARTTVKVGRAKMELDWGRGFLSFKDANGRTQTPGQIIETQVSQTFGLSRQRLVLADRFDEVVTALVNELIKVALSESLNGSSK